MTKLKLRANGKPFYIHDYDDKNGRYRIYFRRTGCKQVELPGPMFSRAFWEAYHDCLAGQPEKVMVGASRIVAGTFEALITDYYQTTTFIGLAPNTKRTYRSILEAFRREYGACVVSDLDTRYADKIIGKVAERSKPQALKLRKLLLMLMTLAVKWGYTKANPVIEAERVRHKAKGYRTWTDGDVAAFRARWADGTPQRIAFELMYYTGLRRSDVVRLGPQHIIGDYIVINIEKSQGHIEKTDIPIHPDFRTFLNGLEVRNLTYIVTQHGSSRSEKAFTNWIRAAAKEAGLPADSSPHGVRKAACRKLAEAGCTAFEIMAITKHKNIKELETYCRDANARHLAGSAIDKRGKVK